MYTRCSKDTPQKDWVTGEEIVTKNIIVTFIENYTLSDSENKGRQGLRNIGDMEGYYITNGKAIKITCEKPSRKEKTVYKKQNVPASDGTAFGNFLYDNANVLAGASIAAVSASAVLATYGVYKGVKWWLKS